MKRFLLHTIFCFIVVVFSVDLAFPKSVHLQIRSGKQLTSGGTQRVLDVGHSKKHLPGTLSSTSVNRNPTGRSSRPPSNSPAVPKTGAANSNSGSTVSGSSSSSSTPSLSKTTSSSSEGNTLNRVSANPRQYPNSGIIAKSSPSTSSSKSPDTSPAPDPQPQPGKAGGWGNSHILDKLRKEGDGKLEASKTGKEPGPLPHGVDYIQSAIKTSKDNLVKVKELCESSRKKYWGKLAFFGNYKKVDDGSLPELPPGHTYRKHDIFRPTEEKGPNRRTLSKKRMIYAVDDKYQAYKAYYTADHYKAFHDVTDHVIT